MKKWISLLLLTLIVFAPTMFAEKQVLLDFNDLEGTALDIVKLAGPNAFSSTAMTDGDVEQLNIDLTPENWEVVLSPSSRSIENITNSYCKSVVTTSGDYEGQTVLGVRVHFPTAKYNSWAKIQPPYDIPSYEAIDDNDKIGNKYVNKGVLRNVGAIKSLKVIVKGRNFPHTLSIRLRNQNDEITDMFISALDFNGWMNFIVDNPNYIDDARKRSLKKFPLYPQEEPYIKIDSFIVYRHAEHPGGDFILYLKSVELIYDLAIMKTEDDINDEEVWGILAARREEKKRAEAARVGIKQLLTFEEKKKMAEEEWEENEDANTTTTN